MRICRLRLRPASLWPVYLAVLFVNQRYGGRAAHLGIVELAQMTGLSSRTVKRALAQLTRKGLLVRQGRYKRLQAILDLVETPVGSANILAPPSGKPVPKRGANRLAPPRGQQAGPSPTCIYVSHNKGFSEVQTFTSRQRTLIADILAEASELLGADAHQLPLSDMDADRLDLPIGTSYGAAFLAVSKSGDRRKARDLTRAVLALRHDPRVQGEELRLHEV